MHRAGARRDRLGEEREAQKRGGEAIYTASQGERHPRHNPDSPAKNRHISTSCSCLVNERKHTKPKGQRSWGPARQAANETHTCWHNCTLLPESVIAWSNKWLRCWRWKDHQRQMLSALPEGREAAQPPSRVLWTTGVSVLRD